MLRLLFLTVSAACAVFLTAGCCSAQGFVNEQLGVGLTTPAAWRMITQDQMHGPEGTLVTLEKSKGDSGGSAVIAVYFVEYSWESAEEPLQYFGGDSLATIAGLTPIGLGQEGVPLVVWMSETGGSGTDARVRTLSALRVIRNGWLQFVHSAVDENVGDLRDTLETILREHLTVSIERDYRYVTQGEQPLMAGIPTAL